jgi:hypothetical protein
MLLALLLAATPASAGVTQAARSLGKDAPRALLVVTPGLALRETDALVAGIEAAGVDVFQISFGPGEQEPAHMRAAIVAGVAALRGPPVALVGHGPGGTLAVQAAVEARPDAVAVVGAPLVSAEQRLTTWLARREVPALGLTPADAAAATWNENPVLPLLLGENAPALAPMDAPWLVELQSWTRPGWTAGAVGVTAPLWVGAGALDNLAPPEAVHPGVPDGATFVRFGLMRLDPADPSNTDLLRWPAVAEEMGAWLRTTLRAARGYGGSDAHPEP